MLRESALSEVVAGDAGGEAEVVFDARRGAGLAAGGEALDDEDAEAFRCAVDGSGHAGGPGAGDDDIVVGVLRDGLVPEGFDDLADGGVDEQVGAVDVDGERGAARLVRLVKGGLPVVLNAIGSEEVADGAAGLVVLGADDVGAG
jgi:hypothetical protein